MTRAAPHMIHLCDIRVLLGAPLELGDSPRGRRRIVPIVGGTFQGERMRGQVLNLGADWQTVMTGGAAELDTRYCLHTHDGALIDIRNFGYRTGPAEVVSALARGEAVDPALYYMRTHCRLETGDKRYAWLNHLIFIGSGAREPSAVEITIYEVT